MIDPNIDTSTGIDANTNTLFPASNSVCCPLKCVLNHIFGNENMHYKNFLQSICFCVDTSF